MKKVEILRKKYPKFIYQKYSYKISGKNLEIFFDFKIESDINFKPQIIIENTDKLLWNSEFNGFDNLIFHLGLIELLSYWKATCSPLIEIRAGLLNKEQIQWWKDLIIKGMGQFFYENRINFKKPKFLKIFCSNPPKSKKYKNYAIAKKLSLLGKKVLVGVGGGKDSVVTLEILKKTKKNIQCFSLNPTKTVKKIMKIAGFKKPIIIRRKIDPKLLELNQKGFLNGHTPFSAYLAFLSVLLATLFNYKYIAFSNERSSNEGNVKYLGKIINHQYSKSFDFEKKFRVYSKKYLNSDIEYFSFLRPLYEIQIAKLFSRCPQYFKAFLSCNEAYKTYSGTKKPTEKWCGECAKCLFVFVSLYPFIENKAIKIFGQNLFEKKNLLSIMLELVGERKFKPFECVGTKKESLIAFYLSWKKYQEKSVFALPYLLKYFENKIMPKYQNLEKQTEKIMTSWNFQNKIPKEFKNESLQCRRLLKCNFYQR